MNKTTKNPWTEYWDSGTFCNDSQLWKVNANIFLRRANMLLNLKKDDTVLNIGCGPGHLESLLASRVKSVDALDISDRFVKIIRKRCAGQANVRAAILGKDYTDINICNKSYSLFLCISVIQYYNSIKDVENLIIQAQKISLPGARMIIADIPTCGGSLKFARDALCSFYLAFRDRYLIQLLKIAFDIYYHKFLFRYFYNEKQVLYFTEQELTLMIRRMGLNAVITHEHLSVYANRLNLLIRF